jgi:hypothetical protein
VFLTQAFASQQQYRAGRLETQAEGLDFQVSGPGAYEAVRTSLGSGSTKRTVVTSSTVDIFRSLLLP